MNQKFTSFLTLILFSLSLHATIHTINVSNFVFTPSTLTVNCNDTIRFTWVNGTHPIVSETGSWTTFTMSSVLTSQDVILTSEGTYPFYCDLHGGAGGLGMSGTITVTCTPPTCDTPTGIFANNITSNSAKINWTAVSGATKYTIQYRPTGTTAWLKKSSTGTSKNLTGLTAATTYQYRVRTMCGTTTSPYSAIQTFTTLTLKGGTVPPETLNPDEQHVTKMGVYPNPNGGEFQLVIMHVHQDEVLVEVFNISGQRIFEKTMLTHEMDVIENIQLPEGFTGKAFVKVKVGGTELVKEITVQ
ncbi:MAG: fibronectin type III domain-containing protein [Chitinophagales bacterium]